MKQTKTHSHYLHGEMNKPPRFSLENATFDFGEGESTTIQFKANPEESARDSHITLLMGANGTCKSRILSSCVNLLRQIEERAQPNVFGRTPAFYRSHLSERDLKCVSANVVRDGQRATLGKSSSGESMKNLPSRVLAIANLVRDRFVFENWEDHVSPFYYYLGVRQASNLTTTGAMDRLVSDALMNILSDGNKYITFVNWIERLFPGCELGLSFDHFSPVQARRLLTNPEAWIKSQSTRTRSMNLIDRLMGEFAQHQDALRAVVGLIDAYGENIDSISHSGSKRPATRVLRFARLSEQKRALLGECRVALSWASSLRLVGRPSLLVKSDRWLEFMQLSSGEQNLLATGARLIGFAVPGSLIVIDEPEVSLNVAWQQRYIELITAAVEHATGSHILIASHSPYLVADLHADNATVVVVERRDRRLVFKSHAGQFWGWGSEAILYGVLGLPSASNYYFSRDLAAILKLVQNNSKDVESFQTFLGKCEQLDFGSDAEPLQLVIKEISNYYTALTA